MARATVLPVLAAALLLAGGCAGPGRAPGSGPPTESAAAPATPSSTRSGPGSPSSDPTASGTVAPSATRPPAPGPALSDAAAKRLAARWRGKVISVLPTDRRSVALIVDCGGSAAGLASILAALRREAVRATFFVTGDFARAHPAAVRRIVAAGHAVGNHTDTHDDLARASPRGTITQLAGAERAIEAAAATPARPWFRFPFGSYDAAALETVNDRGYLAMGWTVDSLGWQGTSAGQDVASVRERVLAAAGPGAIVLLHAGAHPQGGSTLDADALPAIIRGFDRRGYGFTTIPEALTR